MRLLPKVKIPRYEYEPVFGSRKVIKERDNDRQQHFYDFDLWSWYGEKIADLIPEGYIVYGELVGWTPDGQAIQKNYTYRLPEGECELYVYRVATINQQGTLADLSWDGVKEFCRDRGLKWAPELFRNLTSTLEEHVDAMMDLQFYAEIPTALGLTEYVDEPLKLSDRHSADEGICLRQEGIVPLILKAKSPIFLQHETKLLDAGEQDTESAA